MKKLLILGGFPQMINIVQTAREMGIFTILIDRDPTSPAKKHADMAVTISTDQIDELITLCKRERVDGVFTGFEDFNIHIARIICERLGLPFYATEEQLRIVTNKVHFKNVCRNYGIPIVEQYTLQEALHVEKYPYIVKPSDSYGSRGITVCHNRELLISGYQKAVSLSRSCSAIVEQFVESNYGPELFYTIVNGNIYLTATADRYTVAHSSYEVPLPIAEVFPSKHLPDLGEINNRIKKMLSDLRIQNGLVLIQTMHQAGNFYVYEMAFRFSGEQHYLLVEKQRGLCLQKMMIQLALGEDVSQYDTNLLDCAHFVHPSINYAISLKSGTIRRIQGIEQIGKIDEVVNCIQTHFEGDIIQPVKDYSCIMLRINIVAQSYAKLQRLLTYINDNIHVISETGEDMIAARFYL